VIDAFCRQDPGTFVPQTLTKYFDVRGSALAGVARTRLTQLTDNSKGWYDSLSVPPLLSVTTLATDDAANGTYSTVWTEGTDFYTAPYNTEVKRAIHTNGDIGRYGFPAGQKRVKIVGSWGITEGGATPYPIRRTALLLAMIFYRRPSATKIDTGLGGAAAHFGYTDPDVAAILWDQAGEYREKWLAV
jgi:hypothetical protein